MWGRREGKERGRHGRWRKGEGVNKGERREREKSEEEEEEVENTGAQKTPG